jgi:hypothetical protein
MRGSSPSGNAPQRSTARRAPTEAAKLATADNEVHMADNKTPNGNKWTEIVLAWLGMAGAVALMWWLIAE